MTGIHMKAWQFGEQYGSFRLDFGPADLGQPIDTASPDAMPWTLHFVKESGETSDWEHHFVGFDLNDLFDWAANFIEGKVDANGLPTPHDYGDSEVQP